MFLSEQPWASHLHILHPGEETSAPPQHPRLKLNPGRCLLRLAGPDVQTASRHGRGTPPSRLCRLGLAHIHIVQKGLQGQVTLSDCHASLLPQADTRPLSVHVLATGKGTADLLRYRAHVLSALLAAVGYMTCVLLHCWLPSTVSRPPRTTGGLHSLSADAAAQGQA